MATDDENLDYVCSLPPKFLKIAEVELRENENRREQALEQIREWVRKNPRILRSRMGEWMETCDF